MNKRIIAMLLSLVMVLAPLAPISLATPISDDPDTFLSQHDDGFIEEKSDNGIGEEEGLPVVGPLEVELEDPDEGEPEPTKDEGTDKLPEAEDGLYEKLMASHSKAEIEDLLAKASEEDLESLSDEEIEELQEHIYGVFAQEEAGSYPQSVPYLTAGPFMPAVKVGTSSKSMMKSFGFGGPSIMSSSGLELSKGVTYNNDGTYTITMEAYTTGTVTSSEVTTPVDFVLLLDQSGSMTQDFTGAANRQAAMIAAVNNFIGSVAEKYNADTSDHRIALVTFAGSAATRKGWTFVDPTGKTELQTSVTNLPNPSGATNVAAAMGIAETLMGPLGYGYSGTNTTRQKVVILFTDGVPTTSNRFDVDVANSSIMSAKRLKDSGVTVYSIGVFTGANPSQLYGSTGFDRNSNGNVGSYWANATFLSIGDVSEVDIPAGNRFLNYISNNSETATEIGIKTFNKWEWLVINYIGWEISKNENRNTTGYYLSATSAEELGEVFSTISHNIENPNIDLGPETVVLDGVTPYFNVPDSASDVKVYSAPATATSLIDDDWGSRVPLSLTTDISGDQISVTGYNFTENFVSENKKEDGGHGNKLIIEFNITLKDGFLGGNAIPTNSQNSGVYSSGNPIGYFDIPRVDIPIANVTVGVVDKNIYLLGGLTIEELMNDSMAMVGGVNLDLSPTVLNYGLDSWQVDGVNIEVLLKDNLGNQIVDSLSDLVADQSFSLSVKVLSKTSGAPPLNEKTGSDSGTIKVFKPVLTFKDSDVWYGEYVPNYTSTNFVSELWKHGSTISTAVTMIDTKPTLDLTYTPETGKISHGKINTKEDIKVNVGVKIGTTDVTSHTGFVHQPCSPVCGWTDPTTPGDPAFLLHVKTGQLTIKKIGGASGETYIFKVYKDDDPYTELSLGFGGEATINELPAGVYTVIEDSGWSWRYTAVANPATVTLGSGTDSYSSGTITVTNTQNDKVQWLNGFSSVEKNEFSPPTN